MKCKIVDAFEKWGRKGGFMGRKRFEEILLPMYQYFLSECSRIVMICIITFPKFCKSV